MNADWASVEEAIRDNRYLVLGTTDGEEPWVASREMK